MTEPALLRVFSSDMGDEVGDSPSCFMDSTVLGIIFRKKENLEILAIYTRHICVLTKRIFNYLKLRNLHYLTLHTVKHTFKGIKVESPDDFVTGIFISHNGIE